MEKDIIVGPLSELLLTLRKAQEFIPNGGNWEPKQVASREKVNSDIARNEQGEGFKARTPRTSSQMGKSTIFDSGVPISNCHISSAEMIEAVRQYVQYPNGVLLYTARDEKKGSGPCKMVYKLELRAHEGATGSASLEELLHGLEVMDEQIFPVSGWDNRKAQAQNVNLIMFSMKNAHPGFDYSTPAHLTFFTKGGECWFRLAIGVE